MNQHLGSLEYAQEIHVPSVQWKLETDPLFGVERYVPYLGNDTVDLEIRQITRCMRDAFGRRVVRERTRWTLVTCEGRHIGEGFPSLEEAQAAAQRTVLELWIDRFESFGSMALAS